MNIKVLARISGLSLALALVLTGLQGCNQSDAKNQAKAEEPGLPVEAALVREGEIDAQYQGTATLESDRAAIIMSETGGEIVRILVEEGDRVVAGQVLAQMESDRARLMLAQQNAMNERLALDVSRNERLAVRQLVSRDQLDQTRFEGATQRTAVDLARLDLRKTEIRAPFAGVITRRHIKSGQWLDLRQAAFEIADFSVLKARINVPEKNAGLIREQQVVEIQTEAQVDKLISAQVERLSPIVDRASGTVSVTVRIPNANHELRPGQFIRASILVGHVDNAVLVPRAAVVSEEGSEHVFVIENGKVRRQDLKLGWERDGEAQVLAGLKSGSQVVLSGQTSLRDGAKVVVLAAL